MKISELISDLQTIKEIHGDVECSIYADHGQSIEGVTSVQGDLVVPDGYDSFIIHREDLDEYPEAQVEVVIHGQ